MGTISKLALSGSLQGRPIQINTTGSNGTRIHTSTTSSIILDEIWLYATNNDVVQRNLTVEYGATGSASEISVGLPSKSGLSIVLAGSILTGTGISGSTISAYASVTGSISVLGYINRLVP